MKHLKGQQCLFTKTCIETEVSWKSRVVNKNLQIFDVFAVFQDELEARITLKRLLFTTNIRSKYSKYSSERFFSSCGQKMSKDFLNSILGQIIV